MTRLNCGCVHTQRALLRRGAGQARSAMFREDERHREERSLSGRVFEPSGGLRDPDETLFIEQPETLMRRTFDRTLPFFWHRRERFVVGGGKNAGSRESYAEGSESGMRAHYLHHLVSRSPQHSS
jgi:hypothetical protein